MRTSGSRWTAATCVAATLATMATRALAYQGGALACTGYGYEGAVTRPTLLASWKLDHWQATGDARLVANCFTNGNFGCPYAGQFTLFIRDLDTWGWSHWSGPHCQTAQVACNTFNAVRNFDILYNNLLPGREFRLTFDLYTGVCPPDTWFAWPVARDYDDDRTW